jgi:DNA mismatch endonuclease (patch repair protein)
MLTGTQSMASRMTIRSGPSECAGASQLGLDEAVRASMHQVHVDTLTVAERSIRMSRIRSKDTKPELRVRSLLHALGYRYRLHRRDLPGSPDIVFPARERVILVHGCFWHAHKDCKVANRPKSHPAFWNQKFARNAARDEDNQEHLRLAGWDVCVIWECETRDARLLKRRLARFLGGLGMQKAKRKHYGPQ